ncbi:hypothetical protein [Brevibacillus daliensis]|uniref:hypothetical protein n=1 Tax=Brevibacillus daliensis TaxID=2892995 RepID=UPI001E4FA492|nr:hypothetical protein [Brevibacillus daliensis]
MNDILVKIPVEKGVRVLIMEDGMLRDNMKLEAFHKLTIVTQNDKLLDIEATKRKRYR